jgi:integrase
VSNEPAAVEHASDVKRAIRGFGSVYQRGRVWWVRYSHRGREYRESSRSEHERAAWRLLKARWKQIGRGRFVGPSEDRVTVPALLDALVTEYATNDRRSRATLPSRLAPLRAAFGDRRAVDLTGAHVERYKAERLAAKSRRADVETGEPLPVAPATINRELAALRKAFRLAVEQERLTAVPVIRLLPERNAREGFLEPATFDAVARQLPGELQDFARLAYVTGWRKGEVQTLGWSDVDRTHGRITLRRAHSKNGEPRTLALVGELAALIERRWAAREYETGDQSTALSPFVFHRAGQPVGDFRKAWASACEAAGVAGTLFHDLRRSAVRNFEKAGVSQAVAMKISGHKTASVYRRYRIVDETDIADALVRTQAALRQGPAATVIPLRPAAEARG